MLVAVRAPPDAGAEFFELLSRDTGLGPYDLRTRVKVGTWGVLRAIGNEPEARALAASLRRAGVDAVAVSVDVASDPERHVVEVRKVDLRDAEVVLHLRRRSLPVDYKALLLLVRGAVRVGDWSRAAFGPAAGSGTFRAAADARVFRETPPSDFDAYAAVDVHFITVRWIARVDARHTDLSQFGRPGSSEALDTFVQLLETHAGVRVDRAHRLSNLVSQLERPASRSSAPPPPPSRPTGTPLPGLRGGGGARARGEVADQRFDAYSRLVGEAERLLCQTG